MKKEDFCATDPLPCQKNLGIKRIDMPQINTQTDLKKLRAIAKDKLSSIFQSIRVKSLDVYTLKDKIYASQKEINTSRAKDIALKMNKSKKSNKINKTKKTTSKKTPQSDVPVILLYSSKTKEYLVVDGHHRWLAYYLHGTKEQRMKSLILEIRSPNLENAFHKLNKALMKDKHVFHKRHTFKNT